MPGSSFNLGVMNHLSTVLGVSETLPLTLK